MSNPNIPYLSDPSKKQHLLEQPIMRIGRGLENEIVVVSKRVSREHAHIRREGRRTFLDDTGSTNGTFLNGERVLGSAQLRDGDQVSIPNGGDRQNDDPHAVVNRMHIVCNVIDQNPCIVDVWSCKWPKENQ